MYTIQHCPLHSLLGLSLSHCLFPSLTHREKEGNKNEGSVTFIFAHVRVLFFPSLFSSIHFSLHLSLSFLFFPRVLIGPIAPLSTLPPLPTSLSFSLRALTASPLPYALFFSPFAFPSPLLPPISTHNFSTN